MSQPLLPHSQEAEEAILGSCLLRAQSIDAALAQGLTANQFYSPIYSAIFDLMVRMRMDGELFDTAIVHERLRVERPGQDHSRLLLDLASGTPSFNSGQHAQIIVEHAYRRRLIQHAYELQQSAMQGADLRSTLDIMQNLLADAPEDEKTTWAPLDLTHQWERPLEEMFPPPTLGMRIDGRKMLCPGATTMLMASPGSGKTFLACAMTMEAALRQRHTVYLDFESDPTGRQIVGRLRQNWVGEEIRPWFTYMHPKGRLSPMDRLIVERTQRKLKPELVVIDGFNKLLALQGLKMNEATDIAKAFEVAIDPWRSDETAIVLIDHVAKERGLGQPQYAIGSQAKIGLVDYAFHVDPEKDNRIAKGRTGGSKLCLAKDRNSDMLPFTTTEDHVFGTLFIKSHSNGTWDHTIGMPPGLRGPALSFAMDAR